MCQHLESHNHVFLERAVAISLRIKGMTKFKYDNQCAFLNEEIHRLARIAKKKTLMIKTYVVI